MGDPMTYLSVEPRAGCVEAVREALAAWENDWSTVVERDGTLGARRHERNHERAVEALEGMADSVERAVVLTVRDVSHSPGTGRLFVRAGGDLVHVETVPGGECAGVDVVDYLRRHHGFREVGRHA